MHTYHCYAFIGHLLFRDAVLVNSQLIKSHLKVNCQALVEQKAQSLKHPTLINQLSPCSLQYIHYSAVTEGLRG